MMRSGWNGWLLTVLMLASSASAAKDSQIHQTKQIRIGRVDVGAVQLDGRLAEGVWHSAPVADDFRQRDPREGHPADYPTEVRFLHDGEALYIGARMFRDNPGTLMAMVSRRDDPGNSERLIISLDTYRDRRTAYSFGVTATGVRVDYYHPEDTEYIRDYTFDPVWEARTALDSAGWTAEIRIPFSQLRFADRPDQIWGLNMNRWIPDINQDTYWIYPRKNDTGWSSRFGTLAGISGVTPGRRLELLPYVAGEARFSDGFDDDNPFASSSDGDGRAGVDLKMGLGPNLTLDATINPDFGQVDADPAEVNLSAFETFFGERRPFFTEGNELLQGQGLNYYYSRRIGATPRVAPDGDYVETSGPVPILSAAKLTGRLNRGLSLGTLAAVTGASEARVSRDGRIERERVAPVTGYGVMRLQQELGADASTIGLTLTAVERRLDGDSLMSAQLTRGAFSGGVDGKWRWGGGRYELDGHLGFSHIRGEAAAISAVQGNSAHYFQRPDATHLEVDSTQTAMIGSTARFNLARNSGRHWLWRIRGWADSPGYAINDLGRLRRGDDLGLVGGLIYRETVPSRLYHTFSVEGQVIHRWNYAGTTFERNARLGGIMVLPNFWELNFRAQWWPRAQDDRLTRGGPLMAAGEAWGGRLALRNSYAAATGWQLAWETVQDVRDSWQHALDGHLSLQFGGRLGLQIGPYWQRQVDRRQYVTTLDGGRAATFGQRYVFASVERTTLTASIRANFAFRPGLTLQLYLEPFAASGAFRDFGELNAPQEDRLLRYDRDGYAIVPVAEAEGDYRVTTGSDTFVVSRPDFNVRSLRGNLVLRWEWRPGSTLFLVWQQDRLVSDFDRGPVRPESLWNAFSAAGDQYVGLKVNYWLPYQ